MPKGSNPCCYTNRKEPPWLEDYLATLHASVYYMTGPALVGWRHQKMSWTTPVREAPSPS